MTLIAGIVNRHNQPLTDSVCSSLARSLSRNPADKFDECRYPSAYFAKIDIGAFTGPGAFADAHGTSSWLTGEPLLNNQSADQRQDELRVLHDQCLQDNSDAFRNAEGQFCFIQYRPSIGALTLVTDKVGVRPLYLWVDDELVVFASTLRVMEECSLVPKQMDVQAVTEMVAFGTPLSDRTPFAGVRCDVFISAVARPRVHVDRQRVYRQRRALESGDERRSRSSSEKDSRVFRAAKIVGGRKGRAGGGARGAFRRRL